MKKRKFKNNKKKKSLIFLSVFIIIILILLAICFSSWYKKSHDNYLIEKFLKENNYTCTDDYECFLSKGNGTYFIVNTRNLIFTNRSLDYNITIDYGMFYKDDFMNYLPSVTYDGTVYRCFNSEGDTKAFTPDSTVGDCTSFNGKSLLKEEANLVMLVNNSLAYFVRIIDSSDVNLTKIYNGLYSVY